MVFISFDGWIGVENTVSSANYIQYIYSNKNIIFKYEREFQNTVPVGLHGKIIKVNL